MEEFDNLIKYIKSLKPSNPKKSRINKINSPHPVENIVKLLNVLEYNYNTNYYYFKTYDSISLEITIVAIDYLEKLISEGFNPSEKNIYPIFWVCCVIAYKFISDNSIDPHYLYKLSGYNPSNLSKVELWILQDIDWSLITDENTYKRLRNIGSYNSPYKKFKN